ncbi:MAG: phosphoribosylamine--glycine ligase [Verrucomicrobiota bacterium]|nr:phosphoribosylamine--glycine ligase [Verrucomicrobiota bacterium]
MTKKIMVIGGGGREHALVWKLSQEKGSTILCCPGNPGIATLATCENISAEDLPGLLEKATSWKPDLVVVGPDNPLALGIVDIFTSKGFRIFGPTQKAAQFESSKVFTKDFLIRHGIPTARSEQFTDYVKALQYSQKLSYPQVIKADGLALGKGVVIAQNGSEATHALYQMMEKKIFGVSGEKVLIEEFLLGEEVSAHAFVDGKTFRMMPIAQDHKRVGDGDVGPNTGGMGTYSPVTAATQEICEQIEERVFKKFMEGCKKDGIEFKGILFPGLMLTHDGPKVLEFNARFGDPETQVLMQRLDSDLSPILEACIDSKVEEAEIKWKSDAALCVVIASGGYPGVCEKGNKISRLPIANEVLGVTVFHAGTSMKDGETVNTGGRVLGVTATHSSLESAQSNAYLAVSKINFTGMLFRKDIGWRSLRNR